MQAHNHVEGDCKTLGHIERRVSLLEDAFPRDDLGKPNFYGHRLKHMEEEAELIAEKARMAEIKDTAIKQIAYWALGIVLAMLGAWWGFK
jgi:hypothetical protein